MIVLVVALAVLAGWLSGVRVLVTFGMPGSVRANTAVSLALAGSLLLLVALRGPGRVPSLLAPLVGVLPALTAVEYLSGRSLGIDDPWHVAVAPMDGHGRMAPLTVVALLALAVALWACASSRPVLAQVVASVTVLAGFVALVDRVFGLVPTAGDDYRTMTPATIVAVLVAGFCVFALSTSAGVVAVLVSDTAGGKVGRALLPPALVSQLVVGVAASAAINAGVLEVREAFALLAMFNLVGGIALVLVHAYLLRASDLRRVGAETALEVATRESEELTAANAVLSDFAAMAAHDLRAPLAVATAYAELLSDLVEDDGPESRQRVDLLRRLQAAVRRGDEMITDLLAFTRLGHTPLELVDVKLSTLVYAVAAELQEERPLWIEMGDLPVVRADEGLLRSLVHNVLGNALKYVPADRDAIVLVDRGPGAADEVVVRFADNGLGVPADQRERVLRMFERGSTSVSGSGVGLATCVRIAELHGGRFWIEDAPRGGARFCLALPA